MPKYVYRCTDPGCVQEFEISRPVPARNEPAECTACGMPATRVYSVPRINAVWMNSEEHEENRRAIRELDDNAAEDARRYAESWANQ